MTIKRSTRPLDPDACHALVSSAIWFDSIEVQPDGCWLWIGGRIDANGYASIGMRDSSGYFVAAIRCHRVALVADLGRDLGPNMQAGHLCHDDAVARGDCDGGPCSHRRCVNPEHLSEQTPAENSEGSYRAPRSSRLYCPKGHPLFGPDAVPLAPWGLSKSGQRTCGLCSPADGASRKEREALVSAAAKAVGLPIRDYKERFSGKRQVAQEVIRRVEAGESLSGLHRSLATGRR